MENGRVGELSDDGAVRNGRAVFDVPLAAPFAGFCPGSVHCSSRRVFNGFCFRDMVDDVFIF